MYSMRRISRHLPTVVRAPSQIFRATNFPLNRHINSATIGFDHEEFTKNFLAEVKDVTQATDPAKSADILHRLVKSNVLSFTDMRDSPEKFFLAHRLLSTVGLGGFGIRFTVQYNLFAGSIVGLGGPEQLEQLDEMQANGELGCFLLTEMQAGVLSGLIVETTANWCPKSKEFILHTPSDKAAKNWISQGYTAELGVVIADLTVGGVSHGPHPFLMRLRESRGGKLLPGIRVQDMGIKTVANDLDNARVWFDEVRLPKTSLLNKFADVVDDKYVQTTDERMRIEVIGQRLLTGRMAIAEAALLSARVLHMKTEEYANAKVCNGLDGEVPLSSMPQLQAVFKDSYKAIDEAISFTAAVEGRLNTCLRNETIPDADLVEAISVCKIKAIDTAIERVHALRKEVGSYALMRDTGFELVDMFLCCKFAEGDSRILQMKMARDRLKVVQKQGMPGALAALFTGDTAEAVMALKLAMKLAPAGRDLKKMAALFDEHWRDIYALADVIADRHQRLSEQSEFMEPIVERFMPSATSFDEQWKENLAQAAEDRECDADVDRVVA